MFARSSSSPEDGCQSILSCRKLWEDNIRQHALISLIQTNVTDFSPLDNSCHRNSQAVISCGFLYNSQQTFAPYPTFAAMAIDSIGQVIQHLEQHPRWRQQSLFRRLVQRWPSIVGQVVARQAVPVRLDRQILYVTVANPMWAQTLTLERMAILAKVNQQVPVPLQDIRFSSGDWFRKSSRTSTSANPDNQSTAALPDWLRHHPSFVASTPGADPNRLAQATTASSAVDSFRRWSILTQELQSLQPLCPVCRCHCPEGELRRWSRCSICAAQSFASGQARTLVSPPTKSIPAKPTPHKAAPQRRSQS
jgi:predicted nucleic acid-binding Zn ribbon protein